MSDLILTAGIAFLLIGAACLVAGLTGYVRTETIWFPPDVDPIDAHHATLPDLRPWLPGDADPRLEPSQVEQLITEVENYLKEHTK